jgi:hypothetical protein
MKEWSDESAELANYIESAIEEICSAATTANDLGNEEIALWLEWIGEELEDMLRNVLRTLPQR